MSEQNCSLPPEIRADAGTEAALDVLADEVDVEDEPPESEPHATTAPRHATRQITTAALRAPAGTDFLRDMVPSSLR
jgi:hypothetical protein